MTIIDEITRIIRRRQQRGGRTAWLSPQNRAVLGMRPAPAAPTRAMASPPATVVPAVVPAVATAGAPVRQTLGQSVNLPSALPNFPAPPDVRGAGWDELVSACRACQCCPLAAGRRSIVIEDGCRTAPLMFIGEGPGADEDAQGVPFVGRAGQLLTRMIAAMGRDRTSMDPAHAAYIANIVKCRPPGNRIPVPEEAGPCLGYLKRQIALVKPRVIVVLGASALTYLCQKRGITFWRGKWLEYEGIPVMPTFHPAYVLRFERIPGQFKETKLKVWDDLKQVMARLAAQ